MLERESPKFERLIVAGHQIGNTVVPFIYIVDKAEVHVLLSIYQETLLVTKLLNFHLYLSVDLC